MEHFINAVSNNEEIISSGSTGRHALEVALSAIESYHQGKVIKIK